MLLNIGNWIKGLIHHGAILRVKDRHVKLFGHFEDPKVIMVWVIHIFDIPGSMNLLPCGKC